MMKGDPFCLELRYLPLRTCNLFSLEAIQTTPLIELLNTTSDTQIKWIDFRVRTAIMTADEADALAVPVGTPALLQSSTHYNLSEQPIATGRVLYRFDMIEIHFTINNENQTHKTLINNI